MNDVRPMDSDKEMSGELMFDPFQCPGQENGFAVLQMDPAVVADRFNVEDIVGSQDIGPFSGREVKFPLGLLAPIGRSPHFE